MVASMAGHSILLKTPYLLLAVCFILLCPLFSFAQAQVEALTILSSGKRYTFNVELARTPEEQQKGLMFRKELAENSGMLFIYDAEKPISMWMKNTFIPLDILFIRKDGTIAGIVENASPHSEDQILSPGPVSAVLEISGGTSHKLGLTTNDRIQHGFFK